MVQKFSEKIAGSTEFRRLMKRRAMTLREQALLFLVSEMAEREIGRLRVNTARQQGDLKVERERTRFAFFLAQGGAMAKQSLLFLITPYSEMSSRWGPLPVPEPELLPPPNTFPSGATSNSGAETRPKAAVPRDSRPEQPPSTTPKDQQKDHALGALRKVDASARRVLGTLPKIAHEPVRMLARLFGSLSPLTTAVAFALVVVGAIAFATWHSASVDASLDLAKQKVEFLEEYQQKYEVAARELESTKAESQKLKEQLAVALDRVKNQEDTIKVRDTQLEESRLKYQADLESIKNAENAAVMDQVVKQGEQIASLEAEKARLKTSLDSVTAQLEGARKDKEPLQQQAAALQATIDRLEEDQRQLETVKAERDSFRAFTADLLSGVEKYFVDGDWHYATQNIRNFKTHYRRIYDINKKLFDRSGFQKPWPIEQ